MNRAKPIRMTVAAAMPIMIAFRRMSFGRPAAAIPTTIALSPARATSIAMTWSSEVSSLRVSQSNMTAPLLLP